MTPQVEVRLVPHVGMQETPFGPVEVDLGQYFVMAQADDFRWLHMGYICKPCASNPTPPFNGLDHFRVLPQPLKDEIVSRVAELLGQGRVRVTELPEPALIEEEDELEYDADS